MGHIIYREEEQEITLQITQWDSEGRRWKDRPRVKWLGHVKEDVERAGIGGWMGKVKDRELGRKLK